MSKFIPYGKQDISEEDISEVVKVLKSDFLTQGPKVPKFEQDVAEYVDSRYAFAVNSATSALHISCLALDVKKDDIVWTCPNTFVASANCALYCNADIDFVDIDSKTNNISIDCLKEKLHEAKINNRLPKVLIPVHLSGNPCNMIEISKLAKKYGFKIIEDASHAIGASHESSKIGSCKYSDITVFSFHPVKIITTAEGGIATTNNKEIAQKLDLYRSHGITRNQELMENTSHGPWYYEQTHLGYNYRMTELQAALGSSQLKRLDEFIEKRNELAQIYNNSLDTKYLDLPVVSDNSYSSFHLYIIKLKKLSKSSEHKKFFQKLRDDGIGVNLHYIPVHCHPYYGKLGFKKGDFPNSEDYYNRSISIPLYFGLSEENQKYIINKINSYFL